MKNHKLILLFLFLIAGILMSACSNSTSDQINVGMPAPDFTLNSSEGTPVSLSDYKGQSVLLFFHMAEGWPPCLQQIVDLQNDPNFQAMNVKILSIAFDPQESQAASKREFGINVPMLVDADRQVSDQYDVLQWAVGTGEPGHTFILIDENGDIVWIRDYGAPENGGLMYVPVDELINNIEQSLEG